MKKRLKFSQINISTGRFVILILLFFLLIMGFIILLNKKIDLTSKIAVIPLEGTIGYYDSLTNQGINPDDIVSYIEDATAVDNLCLRGGDNLLFSSLLDVQKLALYRPRCQDSL